MSGVADVPCASSKTSIDADLFPHEAADSDPDTAICVHASVDSVVDEPTQRERRILKPVDRFSPIEEAKPSRKRKIGRNLQQPTLKEKKMPALKRGDNPVGVVLSYCATFNVLDVIVSFASLKVRYLEKAGLLAS